jgi:hypothetical protein
MNAIITKLISEDGVSRWRFFINAGMAAVAREASSRGQDFSPAENATGMGGEIRKLRVSGFEFQRLRIDEGQRVPILFLTAYKNQAADRKALQSERPAFQASHFSIPRTREAKDRHRFNGRFPARAVKHYYECNHSNSGFSTQAIPNKFKFDVISFPLEIANKP